MMAYELFRTQIESDARREPLRSASLVHCNLQAVLRMQLLETREGRQLSNNLDEKIQT